MSYYKNQLEKLNPKGEFGINIKLTDSTTSASTNSMALNQESVPLIIAWLQENYLPNSSIELASDIDFGITKEDFLKFLEVLKLVDAKEFEKEAQDGFKDLYNYWKETGRSRMMDQMIKLVAKL